MSTAQQSPLAQQNPFWQWLLAQSPLPAHRLPFCPPGIASGWPGLASGCPGRASGESGPPSAVTMIAPASDGVVASAQDDSTTTPASKRIDDHFKR